MSKKAKNIIKILLILVLVLAYPIYAIVVWNLSKSPDDFSKFPTAGVWVCTEENFVITIDLQNASEHSISDMQVSIEYGGTTQELECHKMPGHGTLLAPVAPSTTLDFTSADSESSEPNYICFFTHKYKFNENDFYLLNISIGGYNQVDLFKENMDLHFIKQI